MKSSFMRQFLLTAGLILLSVLMLGLAFRPILRTYLISTNVASLTNSAQSVAELAAAYDSVGELEDNWDFRMSLTFASRVANTDAVICDLDGHVLLCSDETLNCPHIGKVLEKSYVDAVIEQGQLYSTGIIDGMYDSSRYIMSVPVISAATGNPTGIVMVSTSTEATLALLEMTYNIFLVIAVAVLLLAILVSFLLARSQERPLREMALTARRFGRGDLKARVRATPHSTQEMDEMVEAFNAMADAIEQQEARRQEFVGNVSHELRTPMTTISGFVDGILDGTIPPEREREYLTVVSTEVKRLSRMVRDMLEASRLQSQGVDRNKKKRFNICEVVGRTLLTFEQKINSKQIDVDVDLPDADIMVLADPDAITQVITNLIDNAVKFCPEQGRLSLRLKQEGAKAHISVSNTGPTIPEEELRLIFGRFHKTDKSRSENREGVGLGLYIVKTILTAHNEDIIATSENGVTTFTFTLTIVN